MRALLIFISLLVVASAVSADVYKYTAADGSVYYTDEPKHKNIN